MYNLVIIGCILIFFYSLSDILFLKGGENLAKEAIIKIKEAEETGNEIVLKANENAKQILKNAESDGDKKYKDIIDQANKQKIEMVEKAKKEALLECEPLERQAQEELLKINNPDKAKQQKTIELIVERIVNV